jgi:TonB family protein
MVSAASAADTAKDVEKTLNHLLGQKVVFLRHAYRGTHLRYNPSGELVEGGPSGIWGLNGVIQVTRVKLRGTALEIEGNRTIMAYNLATNRAEADPTPEDIHVEVTLDPMHQSIEDVSQVLSRVFMSEAERPRDDLPPYWKAFVEHKITPKEDNGRTSFVIPELESMRIPKNAGPEWKRPRPLYTPDPSYPERARKQKVQGTSLLEIVIDSTGGVQQINIVRPVGSGLDEMAVDAVSGWRFDPATRDGQAVQVAMFVEVSFHLYER